MDDIPVPSAGQPLQTWLLAHPGAVTMAVDRLNKVVDLRVIYSATITSQAGYVLVESPSGYVLFLPAFAAPVSDPPAYAGGTASGTYSQSEISALKAQVAALTITVAKLTQGLRQTGHNR